MNKNASPYTPVAPSGPFRVGMRIPSAPGDENPDRTTDTSSVDLSLKCLKMVPRPTPALAASSRMVIFSYPFSSNNAYAVSRMTRRVSSLFFSLRVPHFCDIEPIPFSIFLLAPITRSYYEHVHLKIPITFDTIFPGLIKSLNFCPFGNLLL